MSRGRNYSQSNEWDLREDFNSSTYDPQYLDEDSGGSVHLDHCRLYIKNIPKALNEEGLRAAFAKFGTLLEVYLSKDPQKIYALVRYETPGEAKLAMMKMNRTEPLRLQINIAHKGKTSNRQNRDWQDKNTNGGRDRSERSLVMGSRDRSDRSVVMGGRDRDDTGSVASRGRTPRVQDDIPNGENNMDDLLMEDEYGFSDILDPNLHLELENLKLEQLKVREEQLQCKQRVILLKQAERKPMAQLSNRCIQPDGKIVVRNINERDSRDADVSFSAGAGDSLKLPGLQRVAVRQCVVCGSAADAYCAGCGITPYCSERCQRRDWHDRHMSVCHNLARMNNEKARVSQDFTDNEPRMQPAMPLRRPHGNTPNNKREYQERGDTGESKNTAGSITSKASVKSTGSNGKEERFNKFQEKPKQPAASYKQRLFNKERQDETVKAPAEVAKPEPSKMEEPSNKPRAVFDRDLPKVEPVKPAAPLPGPNLTPKTSVPDPPTAKPAAFKPQEDVPPPKETTTPVVKPASVSDTTPTKKLLPKNYLLQKCKVGDSIVMSVEAKASDCRISRGDFVCLTMADAFEGDYSSLCTEYANEFNDADPPAKLIPGETISYLNPEDGGWYRARCLNPTTLALLDSSRIVTVTPADELRKVPSKYEAMPEFCAVLACKDVELGANLNCKILSQTSDGYKVSMTNVETGAHIGEAEVFRWLPTIEYPTASVAIPQVTRRPLVDGSKVLLVLANSLDDVYVRPAEMESQRKYNDVLQEVLLTSMNAVRLSEPPRVGQTVISKYIDGAYYRALVRRINVAKNKYQIEYAEYGNIEVSTLEDLYQCPADCDLANAPTEVSKLKLAPATELTAPALKLIQELLEEEELVLTLPNGGKTVPSGSEATLTIARNKVNLGEKLVDLCKPEWKKIEERGGTIGETKPMSFEDLVYTELPEAGCTIRVLDSSLLKGGLVCGHYRDDPNADLIFNKLTAKMADYCNSEIAKHPYSPAVEELCIAKLPPHTQWFRAVYISPVSNEGGSVIGKIYYLDYGYFAKVPMNLIRKMMPEFVTDLPIMGLYLQIRDFPKDPTDEMIARGLAHMQVDGDGKGILKVSSWEKHEDAGTLIVDAPELIAAMRG